MRKSNVAFKLTPGGGPEPLDELRRVFLASQNDRKGVSWIATRKPGVAFVQSPDSRLLAFATDGAGNALMLTARVDARHGTLPSDALVSDMYRDYRSEFEAYWKLFDVRLECVPYEQLPGTTMNEVRIPDAFRSQLSFSYWLPGPIDGQIIAVPSVCRLPGSSAAPRIDAPTLPLHGVDFSGARETGGRNPKIWIASWYPERDFVELKSGGDASGFNRIELANKVIEGGGIWVMDFPFGPPARVALAAGWALWHDYLAWCGSDADPTALRDELREALRRAGVRWSTKREIDGEIDTTWFPFFEQLYRQTITGARDILLPLHKAGRARTRILPFHNHAVGNANLSVVIEGFPGAALKRRGLPATGYKHTGHEAEDQRRRIVDTLRERGIPICDADASRAVGDVEGDAVDALVLLDSARNASRRTAADWNNEVGVNASIEGWFFD